MDGLSISLLCSSKLLIVFCLSPPPLLCIYILPGLSIDFGLVSRLRTMFPHLASNSCPTIGENPAHEPRESRVGETKDEASRNRNNDGLLAGLDNVIIPTSTCLLPCCRIMSKSSAHQTARLFSCTEYHEDTQFTRSGGLCTKYTHSPQALSDQQMLMDAILTQGSTRCIGCDKEGREGRESIIRHRNSSYFFFGSSPSNCHLSIRPRFLAHTRMVILL
jgi:hypothetical protein